MIELISVHVPKTAGTSFRSFLDLIYGSEAVHRDYHEKLTGHLAPFNADRSHWRQLADAEIAALPASVRVVHGHFPACKYVDRLPLARRIVWLRHPIERLLSQYFFRMHAPDPYNPMHLRIADGSLSFAEFARYPPFRNLISARYLDGVPLDAFDFVGLTESFRADLQQLIEFMNWPDKFPVPRENVTPITGYREQAERLRADRTLMAELEVWHSADMALYRRALRFRAQSWARWLAWGQRKLARLPAALRWRMRWLI